MKVSVEQLNSLLDWLDSDPERAAEKYLTLQNGLSQFFSRRSCDGRDRCTHSEELARETLDRVAFKVEENRERYPGEPDRCVYGFAKFVWKEHLRDYFPEPLDPATSRKSSFGNSETLIREVYVSCLDDCLVRLNEKERTLAITYFSFTGRVRIEKRKQLAEELGITQGNLAVKALHIRRRLHSCVSDCSENSLKNQLIDTPH